MSRGPLLSSEARERLLRRVDAKRQAEGARAPETQSAPSATDFTTLPGYDHLVRHREVSAGAGVKPYLRTHERSYGARTEIEGRVLRNFCSYDYLGLNEHPAVLAAAKAEIDRHGISPGASRHVGGERPVHLELERRLADHYGVEDSVAFVSGYATNMGVIGQLVGAKDLLVMDSAVHNSAVMGGVLSGAARRSFPHNDLDALDELLTSVRGRFERCLIVTEGVFGMDGDLPDLPRMVEIKRRHRAWLMIDEAHALGVIGSRGGGVAEHFGVDPREVDIWMGTLSKTLAGCGGYIAGSEALTFYLRRKVGAFVFSVAMPPALAASVGAALDRLHAEPWRVAKLQANAALFKRLAEEKGLDMGVAAGTAVSPVLVRDDLIAVLLAHKLFEQGINVQPVIHPGVAPDGARLRYFLTAHHSEDDIAFAVETTADILGRLRSGAF